MTGPRGRALALGALRRLGALALTALTLTFFAFALLNVEPNLRKLAISSTAARVSDQEIEVWLEREGYRRPLLTRYGEWLSNAAIGDFGYSTRFRSPVSEFLPERLGHTAVLSGFVLLVMAPTALVIGVFAALREGGILDRALTGFATLTAATPEYVSGSLFVIVFAAGLGWAKSTARAGDVSLENLALPVATIALYGVGYLGRITRAAMLEVLNAPYVRMARMKGVGGARVLMRHALPNALIAPITVLMLQFPWLLTGVVVVEALFNYKGFGWTLVEAADKNDIDLLLACTLVAVLVVQATQALSDLAQWALDPRLRSLAER